MTTTAALVAAQVPETATTDLIQWMQLDGVQANLPQAHRQAAAVGEH
jgi:hypothetical protein